MGGKVSIVDFVHALFKSGVVEICKRGEDYCLGTRAKASVGYPDGREILYSFDVTGLATFAQVLDRLGKGAASGSPGFREGDKEAIAQGLLEDIKQKRPDWPAFLDDRIKF